MSYIKIQILAQCLQTKDGRIQYNNQFLYKKSGSEITHTIKIT